VAQHALCNVIAPFLSGASFAIATPAGWVRARIGVPISTKMAEAMRTHLGGRVYCLKADIRKYFASIDHEILMRLISRVLKDERVLANVQRDNR